MWPFVVTLFSFASVITILVFVHELGHYLFARLVGVHVEVFSIGFGPSLFSWYDTSGTRWQISPIPLGGYVRLHGFDKPSPIEEKKDINYKETFYNKPVWARILVVSAGPVFNFLMAILLLAGIGLLVGKPVASSRIDQIFQDGAAATSGLKKGDQIIGINGQRIHNGQQVRKAILPIPGQLATVTFIRQGKELSLPVTIASVIGPDGYSSVGQLGITFANEGTQPIGLITALGNSVSDAWNILHDMLVHIGQMIAGSRSSNELMGVIGIAQISGEAAQQGITGFMMFMALISLNLGLVNLLPIPVLDGGRLFFYFIELICRVPVSQSIQRLSFRVGIMLIIALFVLSVSNDLQRLLTGHPLG